MSPTHLSDAPADTFWTGDKDQEFETAPLIAVEGTTSHSLGEQIERPAHRADAARDEAAAEAEKPKRRARASS